MRIEQPFDVILADPPWAFRVWNKDTGSGRSASNHYPVMGLRDICSLPVQPLMADNCALFLWATWPNILEAFRVIESWSPPKKDGLLTYRTEAWVWVKTNKDGKRPRMGLGYYTRAVSEPCLLAVRGTMPVAAHDVMALIYSPVRKHSQKPDEQYAKIERLYPDMRYLELFARNKHRANWSYWGNEIDSDISLCA